MSSDDAVEALLDALDAMSLRGVGQVSRYVPLLELTLGPSAAAPFVRVAAAKATQRHTFRLQREYGGARLALVSVALPGGAALGRGRAHEAAAARVLHSAIAHGFAHGGRRWAWLHGKHGSRQCFFFAEEGEGLARSSVASVRGWHIPSGPGLLHSAQGAHKYAARMDLALSKAVPLGEATLATTSAPFRLLPVPDIVSGAGSVMTDGCAGAGAGVMAAAGAALRSGGGSGGAAGAGSGAQASGMQQPPSAFQGRLGGHKGVWYLDPRLPPHAIQTRPSQRKLEYGSASPTTPSQRQVEAMKCSRDRGPSALNQQFTLLLAGWGVPAHALRALQRAALRAILAMPSSAAAAAAGLTLLGAAEGAGEEAGELTALLAAGLWGEHRASTLLARIQERALLRMRDKGRIPCAASRTVLMIADPTGALRPGEAYFRPSGAARALTGPLLLARNPAQLPSDLAVVQGRSLAEACEAGRRVGSGESGLGGVSGQVWEAALVDVLVLPVQGDFPAAAGLSGGDYDGDLTWVCWEESLVGPVAAAKASGQAPTVSGEGGAAAGAVAGAAGAGARERAVTGARSASGTPPSQETLAQIYLSSLSDSTLGLATNLHMAWADRFLSTWEESQQQQQAQQQQPLQQRLPRALWEPPCLELANLCATLVDSSKSGLAPPLPESLKSCPYPHYMHKEGGGGGASFRRSKSALGLLYDDMVALLSAGTLPALPRAVQAAVGGGGDGGGGGGGEVLPVGFHAPPLLTPTTQPEQEQGKPLTLPPMLLQRLTGSGARSGKQGSAPPSHQRQPRLQPHPRLVARSEAAGWKSFEALAEAHLQAFIRDCMRGSGASRVGGSGSRAASPQAGAGSGSSSGGAGAGSGVEGGYSSSSDSSGDMEGSSGGSGSSCDEGDYLPWGKRFGREEEEEGGGAQPQQAQQAQEDSGGGYTAALARARQRLLFTDMVQSPGAAASSVLRSAGERVALALAYYRVTWQRYAASSRAEPHQFPWVVAGDFLLPSRQ